MAPWSFLSGSGSEAEAELPAHMEADADQSRTAFTIFIDGALTNIYNEASGRSKDQRALRTSLKGVIGGMQSATNLQECAERLSGHLYTFEDPFQHSRWSRTSACFSLWVQEGPDTSRGQHTLL